jgi:hypothetical protein
MVVTLLRNKDDHYADYDQDVFERELAARFHREAPAARLSTRHTTRNDDERL